jgi:hypothetical protein
MHVTNRTVLHTDNITGCVHIQSGDAICTTGVVFTQECTADASVESLHADRRSQQSRLVEGILSNLIEPRYYDTAGLWS